MLKISLGKNGETVATKFLLANGFTIVARNYKCSLGEIDIVAKAKEMLYFIEVKIGKNKPTFYQQQKMEELKAHGARCLVIHSLEELLKQL